MCSEKYCWVELKENLEACLIALEASLVLVGDLGYHCQHPLSQHPSGMCLTCVCW